MKRSCNILIQGLLLVCAGLTTSCIGDSLADCPVKHTLTVRAYDADDSDITNTGQVSDVSIYLFDNDGYFMERIETTVGTQIEIEVPVNESITFAGWANASGTNDLFPELTPGVDHIDDCSVGLRITTRSEFYNSPDDIFQGVITIAADDIQNEHILPIVRKTGGVSVTLRKLSEYVECDCDDITVVVRETATLIGFDGGLYGERTAVYSTSGTFNSQGDYTTGIFRTLPDSQGLTIEIYHSGELIRTVTLCGGEPITIAPGRTTNLLIDFSILLEVRISVTGWNILEIWKDF